MSDISEAEYIAHPFSGHEVRVTLRSGSVYLFKEIERLRAARTLYLKLPAQGMLAASADRKRRQRGNAHVERLDWGGAGGRRPEGLKRR